jgi:hypothetical protein
MEINLLPPCDWYRIQSKKEDLELIKDLLEKNHTWRAQDSKA